MPVWTICRVATSETTITINSIVKAGPDCIIYLFLLCVCMTVCASQEIVIYIYIYTNGGAFEPESVSIEVKA